MLLKIRKATMLVDRPGNGGGTVEETKSEAKGSSRLSSREGTHWTSSLKTSSITIPRKFLSRRNPFYAAVVAAWRRSHPTVPPNPLSHLENRRQERLQL